MSKNKICPGDGFFVYVTKLPKGVEEHNYFECMWNKHAYTGVKRFKIRCGICKRRVWAGVANNHDGDLYYYLPPHKIRYWWKRKNKV